MKLMRLFFAFLALGLLLAQSGWAQEKPKTPEEIKPVTPLRVQVVLSEFDGEKRISNLPYTLTVNADDRDRGPALVRMGLRVPVVTQSKDGASQFQYVDVGTNLDCTARTVEAGRFKLNLSVERSSLYASGPDKKSLDWSPGDPPLGSQPIIRQLRTGFDVLIRDGQTVQTIAAADPVSGRVLKVDVTASLVK